MSSLKKIKATTIAEFAVAMTITSIISGLLVASLFFMNKWTHNYKTLSAKYDDFYEDATILKVDMYLSREIKTIENKIKIVSLSNDTITYHFNCNQLIRQFGRSIFDTTDVLNQFEINNINDDHFNIKLITNDDTLFIRRYKSTNTKLNKIN